MNNPFHPLPKCCDLFIAVYEQVTSLTNQKPAMATCHRCGRKVYAPNLQELEKEWLRKLDWIVMPNGDLIERAPARTTLEQHKSTCPQPLKDLDLQDLNLLGIEDQIKKSQWLNVHFRAFQLAHYAWQKHIEVNLSGTKSEPT